MSDIFTTPKKKYKSSIRQINLNCLTVGGETSLPFMHFEAKNISTPLVAIEIQTIIPPNYPEILRQAWKNYNNPVKWAAEAVKRDADILAVRFNIATSENINSEIAKSEKYLKKILENVNIPVIISGSGNNKVDLKLLPALAKSASRKCSIGIIDEDNYKDIIPVLKEYGHNVIARTPIDINLAKQLNILISELGFDPDKIIMDPNIGALGYGLDYAYSIVERIKTAGLEGDNMLNMPIINFVGEECWKTKEARAQNFPKEWGNLKTRAIIWESVTASSLLAAGANIVILYHPDTVRHIKNFIRKA